MKYFLLILTVIISPYVFSEPKEDTENQYIKGYANYYSREGDTLSFIKRQLLYKAFDQVIEKELNTMGKNSQLFFTKFNEKFDIIWGEQKKKLEEQYLKNNKYSNKKDFYKLLRRRELEMRIGFSSLYKVITSYSVDRIWRSVKDSKSRNIKIKAKIDRYSLTRFYYNTLQKLGNSKYQKFYIKVDAQLDEMNWFDIGVEDYDQFVGPIAKSWLNWFENKPTGNIQSYDFFPADYNPVISESHSLNSLPTIFQRSLLLDLNIILKKRKFDPLFKKFSLDIEIDYVLLSTTNNIALKSGHIVVEDKNYKDIEMVKLPNIIANEIYRLPLSDFIKLKKDIQKLKIADKELKVVFYHQKDIHSMFEFLKKLQKNGLEFKLSSKLVKLKGEVAELKLYYLGSWDSLDRVIRREINTFKSKKLEYYPKKDQLEFRVSKSLPTPTQTQAIKKL